MFDQLFISEKNKILLEKAIENNRIHHCYIFVGPDGTEKNITSIEFTKAIFCTSQDKPCNQCIACKKIENGNHPDLIHIFPLEASIKINQLREMQRKMNIKAYESNHKVFIIHNSETMGIPAQNSLLKSLEEPNKGLVIILLTKSSYSILPTILSRGQILHFNPLDKNTFESAIKKQYNIDSGLVEDVYNLSQGCIGKARQIIEHPDEIEQYKLMNETIYAIIKGDYYKIFQFSKWVKENNLPNERVIHDLLILFRNILQEKLINNTNEYKEISDCITYEAIHDIIQEIIEIQSMLKYNMNFQLQIERLLLKLQEEK